MPSTRFSDLPLFADDAPRAPIHTGYTDAQLATILERRGWTRAVAGEERWDNGRPRPLPQCLRPGSAKRAGALAEETLQALGVNSNQQPSTINQNHDKRSSILGST